MGRSSKPISNFNPAAGWYLRTIPTAGFLLLAAAWALLGCSTITDNGNEGMIVDNKFEDTIADDSLEGRIKEAEKRWAEMGIEIYEIEVLHIESIWHAQRYFIRVAGGEIVEITAECIPAPSEMGECEVKDYDADDFTVEGLFAQARQEARRGGGEFTEIEFDPKYGYASRIAYDDPNVYDEDRSWRVTGFEVLD